MSFVGEPMSLARARSGFDVEEERGQDCVRNIMLTGVPTLMRPQARQKPSG